MVKSYTRFELEATFGIVSSVSSVIHIPAPRGPGKAVVGADEAVHLWDLKTNVLETRLVDPQQNEKAEVLQLAFEPHSELIAAGYSDGTIRVWDLRSRTVLVVFNGHKSGVSVLCFDQQGTQLISGSADTSIIVWDLINEQGLYRLKGHKGLITSLILLSETRLLSTSKDGIIKLWDLETQFATESHVAHKGECWGAVALSSHRLATVSNGNELKVWEYDLEKPEGAQLSSIGTIEKQSKHRGISLVFDERSDMLFCASGDAVQIWKERSDGELKRALKRKQKRVAKKSGEGAEAEVEVTASDLLLPYKLIRTRSKISGLTLGQRGEFVVNLGSNAIECYDYSSEEPERLYAVDMVGHRTDIRDVCLSSDNGIVASGSNGLIKLHNVKSRAVVRTLTDTDYVLALRFLPGDGLLVAGTKEGNIDLYDIAKALKIGSYPAHEGAVWSLDVSLDGQNLVSGGADKTVKFWSLKIIEEEVLGHPELPRVPKMVLKNTHKLEFNDDVLAVKLSPDGRFVAASLLDSTVKVYYRETLKFYLNLYGHQLPVLSIDISHDSKLIVTSSADKNIKIWGLDFGDCHKSLFGHDDSVLRVVFEPLSHNFLSASKDGFVKYWDGNKFVQIQKLVGHHSEVWALAIANDGSFAVSASHDKTLRVWEMTDEPLFIEEEREAELEKQYEENLVDSLDDRRGMDADAEEGEESSAAAVSKHSIESLKAGERLFEALDICTQDISEHPSPRHVILATLNVSAERYLMDTLARIKAPMVEDALLTFPLDRIVNLLKFVLIWLEKGWNLQLVSRVLFFCLRNFHKQIVANKMLQPELEAISLSLRKQLVEASDVIGYNLAQLKLIRDIWDENHIKAFGSGENDYSSTGNSKKRFYSTVRV